MNDYETPGYSSFLATLNISREYVSLPASVYIGIIPQRDYQDFSATINIRVAIDFNASVNIYGHRQSIEDSNSDSEGYGYKGFFCSIKTTPNITPPFPIYPYGDTVDFDSTVDVNPCSDFDSTIEVKGSLSSDFDCAIEINSYSEFDCTVDYNPSSEFDCTVDVDPSSIVDCTVDVDPSSEFKCIIRLFRTVTDVDCTIFVSNYHLMKNIDLNRGGVLPTEPPVPSGLLISQDQPRVNGIVQCTTIYINRQSYTGFDYQYYNYSAFNCSLNVDTLKDLKSKVNTIEEHIHIKSVWYDHMDKYRNVCAMCKNEDINETYVKYKCFWYVMTDDYYDDESIWVDDGTWDNQVYYQEQSAFFWKYYAMHNYYEDYTQEILIYLINNNLKINWDRIDYTRLQEDFIIKYKNKINGIKAAYKEFNIINFNEIKDYLTGYESHHNMSDEFIKKYQKDLDWNLISEKPNLSEYVRNHPQAVKYLIALNHIVDDYDKVRYTNEVMIRNDYKDPYFLNPVDMNTIAGYCKLSTEYVNEHYNELNKDFIKVFQYMNQTQIEREGIDRLIDKYQVYEVKSNLWIEEKYHRLSEPNQLKYHERYQNMPKFNQFTKDSIPNEYAKYDAFFVAYVINDKHYFNYPIRKYKTCNHRDDNFCIYRNDQCYYCKNNDYWYDECEVRSHCQKFGIRCKYPCEETNQKCIKCIQCEYFYKYHTQCFYQHANVLDLGNYQDNYNTFGQKVYHTTQPNDNLVKCIVYYQDVVFVGSGFIRTRYVWA